MPRPPLPLNTPGSITVREVGPKRFRARCRFRLPTGQTVQLERTGRSRTAASTALQELIRETRGQKTGPLRPHDRFERAAQLWLTEFEALVADGEASATTLDLYRGQLHRIVLPALGQLRLAECTVGQINAFIQGLGARPTRSGQPMSQKYRQSIRTVVRQVLQQAVIHEAIPTNPARDTERIRGRRPRRPRGLTPQERRDLFAWMAAASDDTAERRAQEAARRRELPDFITLMIGTGMRIGEALGLRWRDVDLDGVPVTDLDASMRLQPVIAVTGNIVRVTGQGLIRNHGKTEKALRVVPLPRFVTAMLATRQPQGVDPDEPVFPTVGLRGRSVTWRDPRNVSGELLELRRAAGIDWPMTSHTFRKTAATIWHDSGVLTDRQSADLTGHAHITTLLNTYISRGELHPEAAAVMDAAWMDT